MLKELTRRIVFNYIFNHFDECLDAGERLNETWLAYKAAEHFRDLGFSAFYQPFGNRNLPNAMISACVSYVATAYNSPMSGTPPQVD